jgi:segregation and condensation protein B
LAKAIGIDKEAALAALDQLVDLYKQRGLRIQRFGNRVQLVSAPEAAPYVEQFLGVRSSTTLSTAAMETLAIVAYCQPVTRARIEAIRGVNSDGVLRTLVARNLVCPVGRLEQAGRPVIYGTTFEFLEYFGLSSLEELPPADLDGWNSENSPVVSEEDS